MLKILNSTGDCEKSIYRPEIDGLRALAVVVVITNHFNKNILPSGYLGVDIFFVISGFIITSSLASHGSGSFGDLFLGFYDRRIKRLLPALVFFVVLTSVMICLFNPNPSTSLGVGWRSLFGISNITLYKTATDYFASSTELNPFAHTWSLGVEGQFYLFFPFLLWLTGFGRLVANGAKNLLWVTGGLSGASLIIFVHLYQGNQPAAYFLMPARFWELGTGCCLFLSLKHSNKFIHVMKSISPLAVAVALVGVLLIPLKFAVQATIAIVILTAVLIFCLRRGTFVYDLLTCKQVVYIGQISYSLYLWHWGILCISRWTIGIHWWSVPIQVSLMLLLAVVSYRHIEVPFRHAQWSAARWQSIGYGIGLSVAGSIIVIGSKSLSPVFNLDTLFPSKLSVILREKSDWNWGKKPDKGCHLSHGVFPAQMSKCLLHKDTKYNPNGGSIFLIGDSHADQYVESLQSQMPGQSIRSFTIGWGCGYIQKEDIKENNLDEKINCSLYNQLVNDFIEHDIKAGDVLILSHSWSEKKKYSHRRKSLYQLAYKLAEKDAFLILMDDVAELGADDPLLCEKKWWRPFPLKTCYKSLSSVLDEQSSQDEMHEEIAKKTKNTYAISLRSLYCSNDGLCGPFMYGIPVYSYGSHLTKEASVIGSKKLKVLLNSILFQRR
jgi:peptidoglycan/LPS O-acetylase OafA/YrhL